MRRLRGSRARSSQLSTFFRRVLDIPGNRSKSTKQVLVSHDSVSNDVAIGIDVIGPIKSKQLRWVGRSSQSTMSYANVTSHYTPSEGQAHADPALLNTQSPTASNIADDTAKVGVVAPDFKKHPATETSEFQPKTVQTSKKSSKSPSKRTHRDFSSKEVADEAAHWAAVLKEVVLRPGVASGLVGVGMWLTTEAQNFTHVTCFSQSGSYRICRVHLLLGTPPPQKPAGFVCHCCRICSIAGIGRFRSGEASSRPWKGRCCCCGSILPSKPWHVPRPSRFW